MSKYANMQADRICTAGGAVRVTLTSGTGQGNAGVSLPCKGCWVQAADASTDVVRMNIGAAADDDLGIDIGWPHVNDDDNGYGIGSCQPMWVPIDDVAKLYFFSGDTTADIDILYLLG